MDIKLLRSSITNVQSLIRITGSKSESNRILILQALYPGISIENLSNSDDTHLLQNALKESALDSMSMLIDIHHAGTAMRFLTAYLSIQEGKTTILTGSKRMKQRPIAILVESLRDLGAKIDYVENEGFPPLKIFGKQLSGSRVSLKANVSSQYISALLLIASKLKDGLELTLDGKITSRPYINMTLSLLDSIGVATRFEGDIIEVKPRVSHFQPKTLTVESDWSSASYFYGIVALSPVGTEIILSSYRKDTLQGDSVLADIYKTFGVETIFGDNTITIKKLTAIDRPSSINLDLSHAPDIAQTIAVTAFGLGLDCRLSGLHTLKIKETDRLVALKNELAKLGANIAITNDALHLKPSITIVPNIAVETYNDHRMAMAFAPLALMTNIVIKDAMVVSKSYPDFWNDLKHIGFKIEEL